MPLNDNVTRVAPRALDQHNSYSAATGQHLQDRASIKDVLPYNDFTQAPDN
jgi:hypothetical protein